MKINEKITKIDSFIRKIDPRIKIIIAVIFSIIIASTNNINIILAGLSYSVLLYFVSRIPFSLIYKRLLTVNIFILLFWIILPFTMTEKNIQIGIIKLSGSGLLLSLLLTLKCNTIILSFIVLISTMSLSEISHALSHLKAPDKLIYLLMFIIRYIDSFIEEHEKFRDALKIKCFIPKTDIRTYKTYAYLMGNLLIKSVDKSDDIYKAMVCRGFQGKYYLLHHFKLKKECILFAFTSIIYFIGMVVLLWN